MITLDPSVAQVIAECLPWLIGFGEALAALVVVMIIVKLVVRS